MSKVEDRIENLVTKALGKVIPKKFLDKPVPQQVRIAKKMISMPMGGGMPTVRRGLLKDTGLPDDFKDLQKKGMNREEIKNHYWQHKEFQEFWVKTLEMPESMFDQLISDNVQ